MSAVAGNGQATIAWASVSGATSYNVYWSTSPGVTRSSGTKVTGATSPHVRTGLTNGVPYYCVVTALNADGESATSAEVSATPTANPPPATPTGVAATQGNAQVSLAWSPAPAAASYNVYWSTSPGVTRSSGTKIAGASSPYLHLGLQNGTTYHYVVTSQNASGESAASAEVSATPTSSPPPAAPSYPYASATSTTVAVSWSIVSAATSYNVYWSTAPGVTKASGTKIAGVTTAGYVHTGLAAGTTYYYVVTALNAAGESVASNQVSATTAPPSPTGVTATGGSARVFVAWTSAQGASSYNVYWSTSPGVTRASGTKVTAGAGGYNHTGLAAGTTYYYVVTAVNLAGESAESAQVSAVTVPAPPAGVAAIATGTQISLTWTNSAGASSYNVYWSTSPGVSPSYGTKVAGASSPTVQTGLAIGTTYYYVVTAVNATGESAASAQVSATTVPVAPTGATAVAGKAQVTVSWTRSAAATSYNVYWSTSPGVTTASGARITGATSPYVHAGLAAGTTYYYVVTAVNAAGESVASNQASGTTVPPVPSGVTAAASGVQVSLSWSAAVAATSYNVYWSNAPGVTISTGTRIAGVTSPFVHSGLTKGTTYYYVATAVNAAGESDASAEASATTVPFPPMRVTATPGNTEATITWTASAGAASYNVYWSTSPGVTKASGTRITVAASPYVHGGLTGGSTVYYVVTAVNAAGESAASSEASAVLVAPATPTGVRATPGDGKVILSWSLVPGATAYGIYWSTSPGVTTANGTRITASGGPYAHSGLANDAPVYYVVTAVSAVGESAASPEVSATPSSGLLASGETRVGAAISSPGATGTWTFQGVAATWVVINAVTTSGRLDTLINLYPPGGGAAETSTWSLFNGGGDQLVWQLQATGTYTIAVQDYSTSNTGTYDLAFLELPVGDPYGGTLTSGQTILGRSIGGPAEMEAFQFAGKAGDTVLINAVETSRPLDTLIYLYPPSGGPAEANTYSAFNGGGNQLVWQLQSTGTYTVVIDDFYLSYPGTYDLTLLQLPAGDPAAGTIYPGQTLVGRSISAPSDMEAFQFSGNAGDRVIITAVTLTGSLDTLIYLYPPGGGAAEANTYSPFNGGGDQLTWQLQATGTYTIVVEDFYLAYTGSYSLSFTKIP